MRKYEVISIFKMAAVSHVVFALGVMADHPSRSDFRGLNSVLKSLVRRINSSGDIAMYKGVSGSYFFPHDVTHRPGPQKDRSWAETRRLSHSA